MHCLSRRSMIQRALWEFQPPRRIHKPERVPLQWAPPADWSLRSALSSVTVPVWAARILVRPRLAPTCQRLICPWCPCFGHYPFRLVCCVGTGMSRRDDIPLFACGRHMEGYASRHTSHLHDTYHGDELCRRPEAGYHCRRRSAAPSGAQRSTPSLSRPVVAILAPFLSPSRGVAVVVPPAMKRVIWSR